MDESRKYCEMCNCPEIQNLERRWESRDFSYRGFLSGSKMHDIWLPRIDQLQEMIKTPELEDPFCMCGAFYRWWREAPDIGYSSMEQLWLGYVMEKLHQKKWNGEVWG